MKMFPLRFYTEDDSKFISLKMLENKATRDTALLAVSCLESRKVKF